MIRSVEDSTQLRFKDLRRLYPYIKNHLGKFMGANLLMVLITPFVFTWTLSNDVSC